ncbi:MAG: MBL fold metallo-hydrolase [Deltaproteobacteria bacterium]|nr:MBL fold metallo-hydrolase [Deltaproteobacteria bacterium]
MLPERIIVGPSEVNCYIVADEDKKDAVVFNPYYSPNGDSRFNIFQLSGRHWAQSR